MDSQTKKTPAVLVLAAWLLVGLPWAWGVDQLWKNARKLFQAPPPAPTAPAPGAAMTGPAMTGPAMTGPSNPPPSKPAPNKQ